MVNQLLDFLLEVIGLPLWISLLNGANVFFSVYNQSVCLVVGILKSFTKFYRGDNMKLTMSKVRQLMGEAFKAGNVNCCDFEDECVNEIIARHDNDGSESIVEEESRIYNSEELRQLAEGTKFHHSSLGECMITMKKDTKFMTFSDTALGAAGFKVDSYPWDQPMKRLSN